MMAARLDLKDNLSKDKQSALPAGLFNSY